VPRLWRFELVLLSALAGCGVSEGNVSPQLAARVNAEPITMHELEAAQRRGATLERVIEERLARQHAIERGLDRAPQVVRALEAARSEILARAWRQHLAEAQPRPTPEEIAAYYAAHPELFAERRFYSLEELSRERRELAAEELPLELLERLKTLKEGDVHLVGNMRITAGPPVPLDLAAAAPLIEKFLAARRSSDALAAEMRRLRAEARIEYLARRK
jgi:hypothetical protein